MFQFGPLGASTMEQTYRVGIYGFERRPEAREKKFGNFAERKAFFCFKKFHFR